MFKEVTCQIMPHHSFDPGLFEPLVAAEDRHFWFRARNRAIQAAIRGTDTGLLPGYRVLEIGCGTGNVLRELERVYRGSRVVGLDMYAEGLRHARQRVVCDLVQADAHRPPFGTRFDLIGLFDVLEHLEDHEQVLRDLCAHLEPGGTLIVTVPAHMHLWRPFDEVSHHVRRYEATDLGVLLNRTGYRVEYLTEYMMAIYPIVWLTSRLVSLKRPRSAGVPECQVSLACSEMRIVPILNELLDWLLNRESWWIAKRRRLPFGTGLLAVARAGVGVTT